MNENELRALRPLERPISAARRSATKEMLMQVIERDTTTAQPRPKRRRRRVGAAVVAAIVVAGAGTAAAAAIYRDRPDARESAQVNQEIGRDSPLAAFHLNGWRPELSAERVECRLPSGGIDTTASEFPLENLLTRDLLVKECLSGNDLARNAPAPLHADSAVVCVHDADYPKPVVLADGSSCADHGGLRKLESRDLETLNRLRGDDVSFLAVPTSTGCPTLAEASQWAKTREQALHVRLEIQVMDGGPGCYRPVTDWEHHLVIIEALVVFSQPPAK